MRMRSLLPFVLLVLVTASAVAQDNEIRPGDDLVQQEIPPIPASLAHDVARYRQGRTAEILAWHPLRREMLIATWFCNTSQTFQVKFPGAARTQLTFQEERATQGVSYEPVKGDFFIYNRDRGGDQMFQIYRHDMDSGVETLLTDGKSRNSVGVWSNAGDRIVYGSTRRNGSDVDLYVMNPRDPQTDRLLAKLEGSGWFRSGTIQIHLGEPIHFRADQTETEITEQLHAEVKKLERFACWGSRVAASC